jgi:hypothetical protein
MDDWRAAGHAHDASESIEALARTVAHLAAQLTVTQLRLRALANAFAASGALEAAEVRAGLAALAESEAGTYLRENLGETLAGIIDLDELEAQIVAFARAESATS